MKVIVDQDVLVDKCVVRIVVACLLTGHPLSLCPVIKGYSEDDSNQENDIHYIQSKTRDFKLINALFTGTLM